MVWIMLYAGVFALSLGALAFEVSLVRVFGITLFHHFAFMVVTIAFLGYAAGGTLVMFLGHARLGRTSLLFAASIPISYLIANRIPFDPVTLAWDARQVLYIAAYYVVLSTPFLFAGMTMAGIFSRRPWDAGRIYAGDLLGAALAPLVAVSLSPFMGASGLMLAASWAGLLASYLLSRAEGVKTRPWFLLGLLLLLAWTLTRPAVFEARISPHKDLSFALRHEGARILDTRWNFFSRVDLVESPSVRFAPGLSLRYTAPLPAQKGITIDGDGLTAVTDAKDRQALWFLDFLPTALPYALMGQRLREGGVFVVDPGGGLPVIEALYHGSGRVVGSNKNPLVQRLADEAFSTPVYKLADIKTGEGRAVLRSLGKDFDLIVINVGTQTTLSSGLKGLTEDYRFTMEAMNDYYSRLKENGILSITMYLAPVPTAELKLMATIMESLEESGVARPEGSVIVYRTIETMTILVKKGEFTVGELAEARAFLEERRFDMVYYAGMRPDEANRFNRLKEPVYHSLATRLAYRESRERLYEEYLFDIRPVIDDRPFFHRFFGLRNVKKVVESVGGRWQILLDGGWLVPIVFVQALLLSAMLIIAPLFLRKDQRAASPGMLSYFFLIGLAYMFAEVSLIEKFMLFFGNPEYAFSAVVSMILASSGLGSFVSRRLVPTRAAFMFALSGSALALAVLFLLLPWVMGLSGLGLGPRLVAAFLLLLPAGMAMGMPFALGIRRFEKSRGIAWAWAVNGSASIMAGPLAFMASMSFGFGIVLVMAGGFYLAALLAALKTNAPP